MLLSGNARITIVSGRQPDHEACPALRIISIGDADPSLVSLDNAARDGEAKAAMFTERLTFGAHAVETAEHEIGRAHV